VEADWLITVVAPVLPTDPVKAKYDDNVLLETVGKAAAALVIFGRVCPAAFTANRYPFPALSIEPNPTLAPVL
jgi:hypothetical protein